MTDRYHISRLGAFGGGVPHDRDGYVHLTAGGWRESPEAEEVFGGYLAHAPDDLEGAEESLQEWAEAMAQEARGATAVAEGRVERWRRSH